jgi:hypothetical protein
MITGEPVESPFCGKKHAAVDTLTHSDAIIRKGQINTE